MTAALDEPMLCNADIPLMLGDNRLRRVILKIGHDEGNESPLTWQPWKIVTRTRNCITTDMAEWERLFPDGKVKIGMRQKLDHATAFILDYFEHGLCKWSRSGAGPQCRWDNSRAAGVLIWTGKPEDLGATIEDRIKCADQDLETYTDWCNGSVYYFSVIDADTKEVIDSMGGVYADDLEEYGRHWVLNDSDVGECEIVKVKSPY